MSPKTSVMSPEILVKLPEMLSYVARILLGVLHTETKQRVCVLDISRSLHHLETKQIV